MKLEFVRKMDEIGRIVLSEEMRRELNWNLETPILITKNENRLILQDFQESCCICGREENIRPIREKFICQACVNEVAIKA